MVTGGVHGDEPSGAQVLPSLTGDGFTTFGPCNPWGLERGRRVLESGKDLNRQFGYRGCPEAEHVRSFLEEHPPGLLLDLHEDHRAKAPYLIQFFPGSGLGRRIIEALPNEFAPFPYFGPLVGRRGLIRPSAALLTLQRWSRRWSLAYYAWNRFGCPAFVVEVPSGLPMEARCSLHRDICHQARSVWQAKS